MYSTAVAERKRAEIRLAQDLSFVIQALLDFSVSRVDADMNHVNCTISIISHIDVSRFDADVNTSLVRYQYSPIDVSRFVADVNSSFVQHQYSPV